MNLRGGCLHFTCSRLLQAQVLAPPPAPAGWHCYSNGCSRQRKAQICFLVGGSLLFSVSTAPARGQGGPRQSPVCSEDMNVLGIFWGNPSGLKALVPSSAAWEQSPETESGFPISFRPRGSPAQPESPRASFLYAVCGLGAASPEH